MVEEGRSFITVDNFITITFYGNVGKKNKISTITKKIFFSFLFFFFFFFSKNIFVNKDRNL